jgi:hypothetical protein
MLVKLIGSAAHPTAAMKEDQGRPMVGRFPARRLGYEDSFLPRISG